MERKMLTTPIDLVASALECETTTLTEESCMMNHPKWDSLSHVSIIVEIENRYEVTISDEEVMKYDNMKAIIELYNKLITS